MLFSETIDEVGVMWVVMGLESSKMDKEGMVWQVTFVCRRYIRVEVPCCAVRLGHVRLVATVLLYSRRVG